jgi:hypothetical protein
MKRNELCALGAGGARCGYLSRHVQQPVTKKASQRGASALLHNNAGATTAFVPHEHRVSTSLPGSAETPVSIMDSVSQLGGHPSDSAFAGLVWRKATARLPRVHQSSAQPWALGAGKSRMRTWLAAVLHDRCTEQ